MHARCSFRSLSAQCCAATTAPATTSCSKNCARAIRADAQPVPRIGDAARLFFTPIEPFLIDSRADHKRLGRIARVSLEPIWSWICRDLIPAEAKALSEDINRALFADDRAKADQLVRALQDRATQRMRDAVATIASDEKAHRRLAVQVGTPRAIEDVNTLISLLSLRDMLADLGRRLPNHIRVFDRDQIDTVKTFLDAAAASRPLPEAGGLPQSDVFLYGLILVMNRLAAPWQLIRIATRAVESDDAARVAETPYAAAVTLVLGETESMVDELRSELKAGRPIISILKGIHDAARGLRSEMDLSVESAWSRQVATIRTSVSSLLKAEIETTPGFVRRLLRPRHAKDIVPGSLLDSIDVERSRAAGRVCRRLPALRQRARHQRSDGARLFGPDALPGNRHQGPARFAAPCRRCRPAVSAIPGRGRDPLLPDRIRRRYAGLLAKAAEVAVQIGAPERKPAHA